MSAREQAKAEGKARYFTGKPCPHGHVCERYVSTWQCVDCVRAANDSTPKEQRRSYRVAAYAANKSAENARSLQWQKENRERRNSASAEWQRTSEKAKNIRRKFNERKKQDPKFLLCKRIRDGIAGAFKGKRGRSWTTMVDFTVDELRHHLKAQFLPGMTWENAGEWHIDHIVPVVDFSFTSPNDQEFKACWSLGNLRPLWADDNRKKRDQRLFLL